jgi:hypothetical protein
VPPVIIKLNIPSKDVGEVGCDTTEQLTPKGNNVNTSHSLTNLKFGVGDGVFVGEGVTLFVGVFVGVLVGVWVFVGVNVGVEVGVGLGQVTEAEINDFETPFDGFE